VVTRTGRVEIETRLGEVGTCGLEEEELSWVVTRGLFLSRQSGSLGSENGVAVFSLVVAVSVGCTYILRISLGVLLSILLRPGPRTGRERVRSSPFARKAAMTMNHPPEALSRRLKQTLRRVSSAVKTIVDVDDSEAIKFPPRKRLIKDKAL
jgi:hypothetical protein